MAQYDTHLTGSISSLVHYIDQAVLRGSMTASQEGGSDLRCGDVRCVTRIYERYSWWGGQRLSLTVTIFGRDGDVQLSAVTAGGSGAMFFKVNTWGEESFLDQFRNQIEAYRSDQQNE